MPCLVVQTSYYTFCHADFDKHEYCYGGGPPGKNGTAIALIKSLIDAMNSDFMEDHADRDKIGSGIYHVSPVDKYVGSIQCWRNMCVMRRKFEGSYF